MSTFVVRFVEDPRRELRGRVVHVRTGEEAHFTSVDELLEFFEGMTAVREPEPEDAARPCANRLSTRSSGEGSPGAPSPHEAM